MAGDKLPYGSTDDVAHALNVDPTLAAGMVRPLVEACRALAGAWLLAEGERVRRGGYEMAPGSADKALLIALSAAAGPHGDVDPNTLTVDGYSGLDGGALAAAVTRAEKRGTLQRREGDRIWQLRAWPTGPDAAPTR